MAQKTKAHMAEYVMTYELNIGTGIASKHQFYHDCACVVQLRMTSQILGR